MGVQRLPGEWLRVTGPHLVFAIDFSALIASVGCVLAGRLPCPLSLLFGVQALGERFVLK